MEELIKTHRDNLVDTLTKNQKRGIDKINQMGLDKFRKEPLNVLYGTVQYNYDLVGQGNKCVYLIKEIYDDYDLNKRLKDIEYKADSIFWEYQNLAMKHQQDQKQLQD